MCECAREGTHEENDENTEKSMRKVGSFFLRKSIDIRTMSEVLRTGISCRPGAIVIDTAAPKSLVYQQVSVRAPGRA